MVTWTAVAFLFFGLVVGTVAGWLTTRHASRKIARWRTDDNGVRWRTLDGGAVPEAQIDAYNQGVRDAYAFLGDR